MPLILDVTRSIRRAARPSPSGIDRLELAYIAMFGQVTGFRGVEFVEQSINGRFAKVKAENLQSLLRRSEIFFPQSDFLNNFDFDLDNLELPAKAIYLNLGHFFSDSQVRADTIFALDWIPVFYIHDLIPVTHPQFVEARTTNSFMSYLEEAKRIGGFALCNSEYTHQSLLEWGWPPSNVLGVAQLGNIPTNGLIPDLHPSTSGLVGGAKPFFLAVGTLEPRKNWDLLLHIWASAQSAKLSLPNLVIVGGRGWLDDHLYRFIVSLRTAGVFFLPNVSDELKVFLMHSAKALLNPSHVEGWGMQVLEAADASLPVLLSDIPAHREVSRFVQHKILGARDYEAWFKAVSIFDSVELNNPLEGVSIPTWEEHFSMVLTSLRNLHPKAIGIEANKVRKTEEIWLGEISSGQGLAPSSWGTRNIRGWLKSILVQTIVGRKIVAAIRAR